MDSALRAALLALASVVGLACGPVHRSRGEPPVVLAKRDMSLAPETAPVGSVRKEPPAADPPAIGERPTDSPDLGLTVWLMRGMKVYRGWPLLLEVAVGHPDAWRAEQEGRTPAPLSIIPAAGGWDSLVKVRLFGPGQKELALPLVQVARPEGALILDAKAPVHTLRWHLGPEETRTLTPGDYVGYARLEAPSGAQEGGWTGRLDSGTVHFQVVDEPSSLTPELAESKTTLFAQYALYQGNPAAAQATLEAHLATQPDSPSVLAFLAQLVESTGDLQRAYSLYGAAIEAHHRKRPKASHPPMGLMERQAELGRRLYATP